jgi:sterol desaturase/sphingolipid hydroxylase (fatty acid hydroxylase superfamily)
VLAVVGDEAKGGPAEGMSKSAIFGLLVALWPVALVGTIGAIAERYRPWRKQLTDWLRWLHASILFLVGTLISNLALPIGHTGLALLAAERHWGLLNCISAPTWIALIVSIVIIDFIQWSCHWTMHHSQLVWRIHRVHHSDQVIDTSTAFRFHPAETLYRFLAEAIAILVIGIPPVAVVVSATLLLAINVWEHANVETPRVLQHLSSIFVTPDFHRIHHNSQASHQRSNLGTLLTIWDRVFGSYVPASHLDGEAACGLEASSSLSFSTLADFLIDPWRADNSQGQS